MIERDIFIEAVQKTDPAARAKYLDEVCGNDDRLRHRVESLLSEQHRLGDFLEPGETTGGDSEVDSLIGKSIGPYKIREKLGEGGFGIVYVAEQRAPLRRKVALKVIKPGMDTREVLRRFEVERQAVSMMNHPNIARALDAGTTDDNRPYFVMELVFGILITKFCDQRKLPMRRRFELFIDVCRTMQHAHRSSLPRVRFGLR